MSPHRASGEKGPLTVGERSADSSVQRDHEACEQVTRAG